MAICIWCKNKYNKKDAEFKYNNDDYVIENNLEGTYWNFINHCEKCALRELRSAYPIGLELLEILNDDD